MVAAALFALYATFLLWKIYATHSQLREDVLTEIRLEAEKRSEAVSYFLSERQNDLRDLADSQDAANFFANRDLGMSLEYGLALSVQAVEERFNRVKGQKLLSGQPIYRDLAMVDANGSLLAGGEDAPKKLKSFLTPNSRAAVLLFRPSERDIVITAPIWFRERYRGQIVAWSDLSAFQAQMVGAKPDGNQALVDAKSAQPVAVEAGSPFLLPSLQNIVSAMKPGSSAFLGGSSGVAGGVGVIKVAVRGSPMALAILVTESQLEQRSTPMGLLMVAGAVPLLVLAGALVLARQKQRHQALTEEKGRLEGRNTELEQEIARRMAVERELRQRTEELTHAYARAEAASHAKSQFLANMAHEIRTPMNGVLGMTELILDGELSEEQREYARIVMSSGQGLLTVLNDILDYSKIEAGMMKVESVEFNAREAIEQVVALFHKLAEGKGLAYRLSFTEGFPERIFSDPTRVRQILSNLLSNAIKFTASGGVSVRAETRQRDDRRFIAISVRDTGIGMDPATLAGLFQAFNQADGSITRKFGGTGLGLVIARNLCQLLGGEISVESTPDEGTTFHFEIPEHPPEAAAPESMPEEA